MALTSFSAQGALGSLQTLAQVNGELARQREQRRREREAARQQALRTVGQVAGTAIGAVTTGTLQGAMVGGALGSTAGGLAGGQGISTGEMLNTGLTFASMQQQAEQRRLAGEERTAAQAMIGGALDRNQQLNTGIGALADPERDPFEFDPAEGRARVAQAGALAQAGVTPMNPEARGAFEAARTSPNPLGALQLYGAMRGALAPNPKLLPQVHPLGAQGALVMEPAGEIWQVLGKADEPKTKTMEVIIDGKKYARTIIPEVGKDVLLGDLPEMRGSERERMLGFINDMTQRRYTESEKITPQDKVQEQSFRQVLAKPTIIVAADGSRREEPGIDFRVYDTNAEAAYSAAPASDQPLPLPKDRQTATTTPKPLSAEDATKQSMIRQANINVKQVLATVAPPKGQIDRTLVWEMQNLAGVEGMPFSKGREARQLLMDSLEAKIRGESGAAVPQPEIERLLTRFLPSPLDSDEAIRGKLTRLNAFFDGAVDLMDFGRGVFSEETMAKLQAARATRAGDVIQKYGLAPK